MSFLKNWCYWFVAFLVVVIIAVSIIALVTLFIHFLGTGQILYAILCAVGALLIGSFVMAVMHEM